MSLEGGHSSAYYRVRGEKVVGDLDRAVLGGLSHDGLGNEEKLEHRYNIMCRQLFKEVELWLEGHVE